MSKAARRIDRLEAKQSGDCAEGCAKCAILKVTAEAMGQPWAGCNRQPVGLFDLLTAMGDDTDSAEAAYV